MDFDSRRPDDIIQPLKDKLNTKLPKSLPFGFVGLIIVIILLAGSFYTIQPNEVGLVLRFGKYVRTTPPGLHLKIPLGVEKVFPVKVIKHSGDHGN